jgi:glycosyltransferase involved in cell wall biosynthesis
MRIIFSQDIFLLQRYGGISRYFFEIAKRISEKSGYQVSIAGSFFINCYLDGYSPRLRKGLKLNLNSRFGFLLKNILEWVALFKIKLIRPEILHVTYYNSRVLKIKGTKIVITIHDMIHELFPDEFPIYDVTSKNKKHTVSVADHVICVSEHTKKDLVKLFHVDEKKISVVKHGFEFERVKVTEFKNPRPYILFVGLRGGYKNFQSLLKAYAFNNKLSMHYDLVAFGGGKFTDEEIKFIGEYKISNNVKQINGDDSLLLGAYKNASIFVYPSMYEGFGIPPLEAMSVGCPVACSNTSSIPEVVGEAAAKFDPESFKSIEKVILKVLNDATYKSDLIKKGYKRVKLFSWNKCAEETLGVYQKVLN